MRVIRKILFFGLLACLACSANPLQAQPLTEKVPEDAKVYIGWSGVDHMGPGFAGSHFEGFLRAVDMQRLGTQAVDTVRAFIAMEGGDPQAEAALALTAEIVSAIWRNPTAFYFRGIDLTDPNNPMPHMALMCQMGDEAAAALYQKVIDAVGPPPREVLFEVRDGMLILASGFPTGDPPAVPPLSQNARFREAMGFVRADNTPAQVAVYVDAPALLEMIGGIVEREETPDDFATYSRVIEALGLNGVGRVVIAGGFDGKDWMTAAFLEAPAPRKGLLKILESEPIDTATFKLIPADADWASISRMDLTAAFDTIREVVAEVSPESIPQFEQGLAQANDAAGFHIVDDLLRSMGTDWVFYSDPSLGGGGMGFVLVHPLRDAQKFDASLTQLEAKAEPALAQATADAPFGVMRLTRSTYGGITVRSINFFMYAISWSVHEGRLYFGMYPQTIAAATDNAKAGSGPKLNDEPKLRALLARLGDQPYTSLSYTDLSRTMPKMYQLAMMGSQMLQAFSARQGMPIQPLTLPPLNRLMPHFTETAAISWVDETGFHSRSISPFPGSSMFSLSGTTMVGGGAAAVGIMLPALGRARELANRTICATNLHDIYKAAHVYAISNDEKFPPDLGTLVAHGLISPSTLLCPSVSDKDDVKRSMPPIPLSELGPWANSISDFVYLSETANPNMNADAIVAYEPLGRHRGEGVHILFGDGHVEFVVTPRAAELLRAAGVEIE